MMAWHNCFRKWKMKKLFYRIPFWTVKPWHTLSIVLILLCFIFYGVVVFRQEWLKENFQYFHEDDAHFFSLYVKDSGNGNIRSDNCSNCNPHRFSYTIKNDAICKVVPGQPEVDLFVFLLTTVQRVNQRDALRETWLSFSKRNTGNIRYVFLVGKWEGAQRNFWQRKISHESQVYNDILQEDFLDTYRNLSLKVMMGFKYAAEMCRNAKFVMKTDDDMWINVPTLLRVLAQSGAILQSSLGGRCDHQYHFPSRKNPRHKWYVSYRDYPHEVYPLYCFGLGYVTSWKVAKEIVKVSSNVPFFPMEDVYIGLCLKELGYGTVDLPGFIYSNKFPPTVCDLKGPFYITRHNISPNNMLRLWNTSCSFDYKRELLRQV